MANLLFQGRAFLLLSAVSIGSVLISSDLILVAGPFGQPANRRTSGTSSTSVASSGKRAGFSGRSKSNTVRLFFHNSAWETVIRKVAKSTGSTLVMDEIPPGRFTRRDFSSYSRTDALRVLNQSLEPEGFRLLEKGEFLTVVNMRSLRTKYAPSVIPTGYASDPRGTNQGPAEQQYQFQPMASEGRGNQYSSTGGSARRGADPRIMPQNRLTRRVESLGQTPYANQHPMIAQPPAMIPQVTQQGRPVLKTVRTTRPAVDISRMIYAEMKNRSELLDVGPAGLPAFRVFQDRSAQASGTIADGFSPSRAPAHLTELFAIGIDSNQNTLVISASPAWAHAAEQLIHSLDSVPTTPYGVIQLISHKGDVRRLAAELQPQLNLMVAQRSPNGQQSNLQNARQPAAGSKESLLLDIRGQVEIEFVPGIGLILKGNEKDVERVQQIIDLIDKAAQGTVPEIQLHYLRNVNSESMASLLNNIYSELENIRSGDEQSRSTINILPVVNPNAILILAPKVSLEAILKTIADLDRPVDPNASLEVFRLKYAIASRVATHLESLFPQPQDNQTGLRARIVVVADSRTNSVIVQAQPRDMQAVSDTIRKLDKRGPNSVNRMQVFPLKNSVAEDLAEVINNTLLSVINPARQTGQTGGQFGGGGQTNQELIEVKSVILEFFSGTERGKRVVRSGVLADIRVTAEPRTNALVVTAPEESMSLMQEMIAELDKQTSMTADIKIVPLKNADASAMVDLLESLFTPDNNQQGQAEVTFAGGEDVSSGLVPLRFSVDVRTNSVIAAGGAGALQVVEAILFTLDESDLRRRTTEVIQLKNIAAEDVANAITLFLRSQRDLAQLDPDLISNVELLEREVIVVPEAISNSLLVSTTPRYHDEIMKIIETLDAPPSQVVIQALIVEVELDNTDEFGVELGFQDSMLFDRGLLNAANLQTITQTVTALNGAQTTSEQIINQESIPGFNFGNPNQPLGNNTSVNPSSVGSQGLSNFSLGRVNGDLGYGGLVLSAQSEAVSVLIRALASRRQVHVLSRPQIRTLDNVQAQIHVGQVVPVVTGFTPASGNFGPTPLVQQQDAGIILDVTPRISPDGTISITVIAEKSEFSDDGVVLTSDINTGAVIESPIKDEITAVTTISVPDGQTVVLGGMITSADSTLERKVPLLGDIPLLGSAFRYDSTSTRRTELLIFLTPRIVRNDADSEFIKQVETERMHFIQKEAEEIHGPLFAIPSESNGQEIPPLPPEDDQELPMTNFDSGQSIPTSSMSGENRVARGNRQRRDATATRQRNTQTAAGQKQPWLKKMFGTRSN